MFVKKKIRISETIKKKRLKQKKKKELMVISPLFLKVPVAS